MFQSEEELTGYIKDNYEEITDSKIDNDHWDIYCQKCKIVRGFQVVKRGFTRTGTQYSGSEADFDAPQTIYFHCPVCNSFKMWIVFVIFDNEDAHYFRVSSIPNEGVEDIEELPDTPASLRKAYKQAIRAMDANAYIAAAAMFRRALQVITRDILGATPGNLGVELNSLIGKQYNGVTLTKNFADNGYIVKEVGNQGAHPDDDSDLLDFTQQDSRDLQKIFMEIVSDIFVIPEVSKRAKEEFLKRRKIVI